jgi:hypothetical protein
LKPLSSWIADQPSWSDLPFIALTQRGGGPEKNPAAARLSEILGNVTFLERPFHATTFVSAARTAMKGRRRQYEARARLNDLADGERRLHAALEAGRLGTWELQPRQTGFQHPSCVALSSDGLKTWNSHKSNSWQRCMRTTVGEPNMSRLSYTLALAWNYPHCK